MKTPRQKKKNEEAWSRRSGEEKWSTVCPFWPNDFPRSPFPELSGPESKEGWQPRGEPRECFFWRQPPSPSSVRLIFRGLSLSHNTAGAARRIKWPVARLMPKIYTQKLGCLRGITKKPRGSRFKTLQMSLWAATFKPVSCDSFLRVPLFVIRFQIKTYPPDWTLMND